MSPQLQISFYVRKALVFTMPFDRTLELGRRGPDEGLPFQRLNGDKDIIRLVAFAEMHFSRRHCAIIPANDSNNVVIRNISRNPLSLAYPRMVLHAGESSGELDLPVELDLPITNGEVRSRNERTATIELVRNPRPGMAPDPLMDHTFNGETALPTNTDVREDDGSPDPRPGAETSTATPLKSDAEEPSNSGGLNHDMLRLMLSSLNQVGQSVDVYTHIEKTIQQLIPGAAVTIVGINGAAETRLSATPNASMPSRTLMRRVRENRLPLILDAASLALLSSASTPEAGAILLIPLENDARKLTHAIYIEQGLPARERGGQTMPTALTLVDLELYAALLATVLSVEMEWFDRKNAMINLLMEFLPRKFARELIRDPSRITSYKTGINQPVTVLFCDVRGSAALASRTDLNPADVNLWRDELRGAIKRAIEKTDGDVFDTQGDSVAAVWYQASPARSSHADNGCEAALLVLGAAREISRRWEPRFGLPTTVGIGVATGTAALSIGEGGIYRKFSPDGHVVNLASRLEGTTKFLRVPILISKTTFDGLQRRTGFAVQELLPLQLAGIPEPQVAFAIAPQGETINPVFVLPGK